MGEGLADPMVKPFAEVDPDKIETLSDQYSSIRSPSWKSNKSEDDSPQRKKMIRSPGKRNIRRYDKTDAGSQRAMERLLNESDLLDTKLKMQLQYIQEIRRDTQDAISNSE